MSPFQPPRRGFLRWSLWIGYWVFLFVGMHTPAERMGGLRLNQADKVVHFLLYGLLTWLGARRLAVGTGVVDPRRLLIWAAVYVAYAALDEYLQQFVGRTASVADWFADTLGVLTATAILAFKARGLSEPAKPV